MALLNSLKSLRMILRSLRSLSLILSLKMRNISSKWVGAVSTVGCVIRGIVVMLSAARVATSAALLTRSPRFALSSTGVAATISAVIGEVGLVAACFGKTRS